MSSNTSPPLRRDVAGRIMLALAAVAAAAASMVEISALGAAGHDVAMLAGWRALGLGVFAGVFALLAWRPRGYPGLLELAMGHKVAMALHALGNLDTSSDAATVAVADGVLALVLAVAYVLVRAHRAWVPAGPRSAMPSDPATQTRRVLP